MLATNQHESTRIFSTGFTGLTGFFATDRTGEHGWESFLLRKARKSAEGNGTINPNRPKNAADYTSFSPARQSLVFRWPSLTLAKKSKSAALWLKSVNGSVPVSLLIFACWGVKHGLRGSATLVRQMCVRFRFFARRDLTRIKTASHEWATKPYNRTRIPCLGVGHFFRPFRSLPRFP